MKPKETEPKSLDILPRPVKPSAANLAAIVASGKIEEWASQASVQDVYGLVKANGVEECAEVIRFLHTDKLRAVIDLDVWKNMSAFEKDHKGRTGRAEKFDASQFLLWLQALLSSGVDEAVDALAELGTEFCAGAFSHFLRATAMDVYSMNKAESGLAIEDKNVEHGNPLELGVFGGSYVQLKPGLCLEDVAEVFQEILSGFEQYAPEVLEGVFYHIAKQVDDRVAFEDFKTDRDLRLESQGYITAAKASEFLLRFRTEWGISRFSGVSIKSHWDPQEFLSFLETIKDKKISASENTNKVTRSRAQEQSKEKLLLFMEWTANLSSEKKLGFQTQWLFLANLLATGWEHQGNKLSPKKALEFLESVVSFSLDHLQSTEQDLSEEKHPICNVCELFELGWHKMLETVSLRVAKKLDERIRLRDSRNSELREVWFRFCQARKFKEFSVARWIFEGRYKLVSELLSEIEFAFASQTVLRLRLLLDPSPAFPSLKSLKSNQAVASKNDGLFSHKSFGFARKISQKSKWIRTREEVERALFALESELQL